MYDHRNLVLLAHHTSQKTGNVDGKRRIANLKEKRVQGAMKSKNSKRRFLLARGKGSRQKAWIVQEGAHKTWLAIARLKIETVMELIEPMMKRKKQKLRRNLLRKKKRMMLD